MTTYLQLHCTRSGGQYLVWRLLAIWLPNLGIVIDDAQRHDRTL
jgi:hypothetical protein